MDNEIKVISNKLLQSECITLTFIPLRNIVVFPYMIVPVFLSRSKSVESLRSSMDVDKRMIVVSQKESYIDEINKDNMYHVGCIVNILQVLKLPDGTIKLLIEGVQRAKIISFDFDSNSFLCKLVPFNFVDKLNLIKLEALKRLVIVKFTEYIRFSRKISEETLRSLIEIEDLNQLSDILAVHLPFTISKKQEILSVSSVMNRFEIMLLQIEVEFDIFEVEKKIQERIRDQIERNQREYYLHEQMIAINRELGYNYIENDFDTDNSDFDKLEDLIYKSNIPKDVKNKICTELKRFKRMPTMSAESMVIRNYIDILIGLPWCKKTTVINDLIKAYNILENDHFGLKKIKERILEYLAVQQRVKKVKSQILCLVGPPGVGKTSLGRSIASATNRKFIRMALGGIHDEGEIRGHRRTYVGSMPGKILQNLIKVGVRNPLFLLDEIDKLGYDRRGDPSSALLEVLDPEQNNTFVDHYVDIDFDLSDVMFIATANTLNIIPPLLDRMEIIFLSGYTEEEKVSIALKYLIPKQKKETGLRDNEIDISKDAICDVIRYYTRESGVRSLERIIAKICRKVVKFLLTNEKKCLYFFVDKHNLHEFVGVRKYDFGIQLKKNQIGQVVGLAWTEAGGELLNIEAVVMPGKGNIIRTGYLGDVMKESVEAACSVVKSRSDILGIKYDFFEKKDIHIHVPEGATPKDGPSAGVAITTALVSAVTGISVRYDVAMTGEITLRGEILQIGGLKEKILAAYRSRIKMVLIPKDNMKDLSDIPDNVKKFIKINPVRWIDEVLGLALEYIPDNLCYKK